MMNARAIPLTDARGLCLVPEEDLHEPMPASVVLVDGLHGTAWQRFFSDGKWHSITGRGVADWAYITKQRNVVLLHDASERKGKAS